MGEVLCSCGCGVIFDTSVPTYWNGIPITSERGSAIVAGERIPVVMVNLDGANYGGGIDYLDNRNDQGWRKIAYGYGSPRYGHRNVTIEPGSFTPEAATPPTPIPSGHETDGGCMCGCGNPSENHCDRGPCSLKRNHDGKCTR